MIRHVYFVAEGSIKRENVGESGSSQTWDEQRWDGKWMEDRRFEMQGSGCMWAERTGPEPVRR